MKDLSDFSNCLLNTFTRKFVKKTQKTRTFKDIL